NPQFRYARRYHYGGDLNVDYVRNRRGERDDPDFTEVSTSSVRWIHRQELSPTSQFNANVNLSSQNYLQTISESYDDRVRQTVQSSIRYNKNWQASGRNVSVDLNHRQQLSDGSVSVTLPSFRFNQGSRKPFDLRSTTGNSEKWFERITYTYSSSLDNQYNFKRIEDDSAAQTISWTEAMFSPSKYRRATGKAAPFDTKASHRVRSSASFSVNRIPLLNTALRLFVSPNVDYSEDWFLRTDRQRFDTTSNRVVRESVSDFLALRQFSSGISANTTFYGTFPFRLGPYQGFRHTVRPSIGFNYQPDFYDDFWGYTDTFLNSRGEVERYGIVSGVRRGEQKALSMSLSNVFETKRAV
ncbi:MAG: putative LPS assembly protein LptD, partial [Rhodothermales bacterium]